MNKTVRGNKQKMDRGASHKILKLSGITKMNKTVRGKQTNHKTVETGAAPKNKQNSPEQPNEQNSKGDRGLHSCMKNFSGTTVPTRQLERQHLQIRSVFGRNAAPPAGCVCFCCIPFFEPPLET